ncbi:MAG: hypothetical protein FIB05_17340, partial [Betaproteobacteria bacterium]|nr:hypothetical protein [Betaproteobacteria bacterium]
MRAVLLAAVLATGCATVPPPAAPPPAPAAPVEHTASRLLASLARLLALDAGGLASEIARRRAEVAAAPGDLERVEAAMAAAMAPAPADDLVLALVAPGLAAGP